MTSDYIHFIESSWSNSDHICALADTERHLGHLVKADRWHAYDATHPNQAVTGFNYLGAFEDLAAAKQAVELAVAGVGGRRTMAAGRSWQNQ